MLKPQFAEPRVFLRLRNVFPSGTEQSEYKSLRVDKVGLALPKHTINSLFSNLLHKNPQPSTEGAEMPVNTEGLGVLRVCATLNWP